MYEDSRIRGGFTLPDNIKGRSIHSKIVPANCKLEKLLDKFIGFYRDETKLKPHQFECYTSYNIGKIKSKILKSKKSQWKEIIREHILSSDIKSFGNHVIDIYLVAYVCETYGYGKEKFFQYLKENNITEKPSSMEAIWDVGQGDGVYLGILNEDGTVMDWEFLEKWLSLETNGITGEGNHMPTILEAENMLREAERLNPGEWVSHSINVGVAAEYIAKEIQGMNPEKAKILGMLHDVGRRVGRVKSRHVIDGYNYCIKKGFPQVAKVCMTHGFLLKEIEDICGEWDCTEEEYNFAKEYIENSSYDDYDLLIQLCDVIADDRGFCLAQKRMIDVIVRYGVTEYTHKKLLRTFEIIEYFESKIGKSIYSVLPGVKETTFDM